MGAGSGRRRRCVSAFLTLMLATALVPFGSIPAAAATLTVCTDGSCDFTSIAAAVAEANGGDTVLVEPGDYQERITVDKDLTIEGTADGVTIVPPDGADQSLVTIDAVSLALQSIDLAGGFATNGGAVSVAGGQLEMRDVTVTESTGSESGGGIFASGSTVIIENSTFEFNNAPSGGAIHVENGELTVDTSLLSLNGAFASPGRGGAISSSGGPVTITASTFTDNGALDGGAIHITGGNHTITTSTFSSNVVELRGGAIHVDGILEVNESTFVSNNASNGGAMYLESDGSLVTITSTILYDNDNGGFGTACSGFTGTGLDRYYFTGGWNFMEDVVACAFNPGADDIDDGGNPQLSTLSGSPVPVHTPLDGSPVIDAGDVVGSGFDQLGTVRPQGPAYDIGAVEVVQAGGTGLSLLDTQVSEASGPAVVTAELSAAVNFDVTFDVATEPITASEGEDYAATFESALIPAGSTEIQLEIPIVDDVLVEADETFTVIATNLVGAIPTDDTAEVTIVDDDVNTPPVAVDDFIDGAADTSVWVQPTANDTDANDDPLRISSAGPADFGGLGFCDTDAVDGYCDYYPALTGGSFPYTVTDGTDTDEGVVTVTASNVFAGSGSATIDGEISPGEWDGAATFEMLVTNGPGNGVGSAYLMNDGTNLYMGFVVEDMISAGAWLEVWFDDPSSDAVRIDFSGYRDGTAPNGGFLDDATSHGSGARVIAGDGTITYEFVHPLNSGDPQDISTAIGQTVGFSVHVRQTPDGEVGVLTNAPGGELLEWLDWDLVGSSVAGVTVDVATPSVSTGFVVPLDEVPSERLLAAAEAVTGVELDAIGLVDSPLGSIPLGSIPLGSIATGSVATVILSDVPIEGGWGALLAGTPLENRPLQTVTLAEALTVIPAEALAGITLADIDLGDTGAGDLSLAALALGEATLTQLGLTCPAEAASCNPDTSTLLDVEAQGAKVTSVPLGSIPLGSIPLGSIPLGSIPLGSIPLGSIPLGSIGDLTAAPLGSIGDLAAAPLGSIPLGSIPLGSIPLGSITLGAATIASLPLGSIPLGSIDVGGDFCTFHNGVAGDGEQCADLGIDPFTTTVSDYLALLERDSLAATPLGSIPLGSIPLGSIPLGSISIAGIPLGSIPVGSIDLAASPLGSIPLGSIPLGSITVADVCAASTTTGCDGETTLAEWAAGLPAGSDVASSPLGSIPIDSLPLGSIPLGSIDLTTVEIAGLPLGSIPLGSIDLAASPLGSIPLGSISAADSLVDCSLVDCVNGTLALAASVGAVRDLSTLSALLAALDPGDLAGLTLGDVLDHLSLSLLGEIPGLDGLTLGELLVPTLVAADLPWEEFPLEDVEVRDVACGFDSTTRSCATGADVLDVDVGFDVVGDIPLTSVPVTVSLPPSFFYLRGSAELESEVGGDVITTALTDPVIDGADLTFDVGPLEPGIHTVRVAAMPGFDLETVSVSVTVSGSLAEAGPIDVVQRFEPNDVTGEMVDADTLYVTHVADASDIDAWVIPAPGQGNRISVYLSNLDGDVDTFMYRPDTAPVSGPGTERSIPLGATPVEDDGVDVGSGGSLEPEVLADTPPNESLALSDASTNRGTENEKLTVVQSDSDVTEYTIEVSGYNGASSTRPYVLRVAYDAETPVGVCTPRPYGAIAAGGTVSIPAGVDTIFLVNRDRMQAIHGDLSAVDAALASVAGFTGTNGVTVNGAVVDIADIAGVPAAFAAWDANPCDPGAANDVVGLISAFVQDVASSNPSLRHVTVIGSDEVVPFHRAQDTTVVANENTYTDGFADNALFGALSTGHYLSDAPYGDLDPVPWLDRFAYVPELSLGRLVETPAQIAGALQSFIDNQGVLDPGSAATAGYDFLSDGSTEVDGALAGFLPATETLINETWTRADLSNQFAAGSDVLSPNAHYDHYRALPALGNLTGSEADLFTVDDVSGLDLANRIIFTMGCHGGLNVDATAGGVTVGEDWAEVYGGLRAVYIGNTGYGYGDSVTVALTEQVMVNLAERLDGRYTIGQALSDAKQEQFGKAGLYGVYDLKAIEEATLYGLPFWRIDGPGASTVPGSETGLISVDPLTGLDAAPFSIDPTFQTVATVDGSYVSSDEGTQFMHWRPIQPLTGLEVGVDGRVVTGTILTGLVSEDSTVVDAAFARPSTTDQAGREPEIETDGVIFPTTFATVATFGQVNAGPEGPPVVRRQRVNLIAGQYFDQGTTAIQRLFTTMQGVVFYLDDDAVDGADFTPPSIDLVEGDAAGDQAVFRVRTSDSQSGVARVVVLYVSGVNGGSAVWTPVDLSLNAAGDAWVGGGPIGAGVTVPVPFIVQVVNGDGVVGVSTFKRGAHQADSAPAVSPPDAVDDTATTDAGVAVDIAVLGNDDDPDGDLDPMSLAVVAGPTNGTAEVLGAGIRYTPADGFAGMDQFTYRVCDLTGLCDVATVDVTVVRLVNPPDAVDDEATGFAGIPVDIDVLSNDSDPDGDLDPASLAVTGAPANGAADVIGESVTYTADAGFVGSDSFIYRVCDLTGLCDEATVNITVLAAPSPPDAVDDSATVTADIESVIDVLSNDSDPDGDLDPTSLSVVGAPSNGSAAPVAGAIAYTPSAGFTGHDTLVYEVCDLTGSCNTAVVDITVVPEATAPVAVDDHGYAVTGDPITVFVLDNDIDADGDLDPATLSITTPPPSGSADVVAASEGPVVVFTPGAPGQTQFVYTVCDSNGECDSAVVVIDVGVEQCTIVGTTGNDVLFGTRRADVICGLAGNDVIFGLRGNDVIIGGPGNDTVFAGDGDDVIHAGDGDDTADGQDGDDRVLGGAGTDSVHGGGGADVLQGNSGADLLTGGADDDLLLLGTGADAAYGDGGSDEIRGDLGGAKLIGGGSGPDLVIGGEESDVISGGFGPDRIETRGGSDLVFAGPANDDVDSGPGSDLVFGGAGNDALLGGSGADILWGDWGNDTLAGAEGNDLLFGGSGTDVADGGGGSNTCEAETAVNCS